MDCLFDQLQPGSLLPDDDVLIIFTSVDREAWLASLTCKRRRGNGASTSHSSSNRITKKDALVEQLVAHGRGTGMTVHSEVLKHASRYFAAQLERWQDGACRDVVCTEQGQTVLVLQVEEQQLGACIQLLRSIKTGLGPSDKEDVQQLIMVARLADQYELQACARACFDTLAAMAPDRLSEQVVCQIFELPETLMQQESGQKLRTACVKHLVQAYSGVVSSQELQQRFCALPFAAVHAWAGANYLPYDSEETVLALLEMWLQGPQGQDADEEQQTRLAACVRLMQIRTSAVFLTGIHWLGLTRQTARVISPAQRERQRRPRPGEPAPANPDLPDLPPSWTLGERTSGSNATAATATLTRDKVANAIQQTLANKLHTPLASRHTISRGLMWTVTWQMSYNGAEWPGLQGAQPYASLACYMQLREEQLVEALSPRGRWALSCKRQDGKAVSEDVSCFGHEAGLMWGHSNIVNIEVRTVADLEPFFSREDDCIHVSVKAKDSLWMQPAASP